MTSCESEGGTVVPLYGCTVVLLWCCGCASGTIMAVLSTLFLSAMIDSRGNYVANLLGTQFWPEIMCKGTYLGYAVCGMRESTD